MTTPIALRSPLSALLLAVLAACGGADKAPPQAAAPAVTTAAITGKAVDGPLQGATACYDLNDNGACDAAEPASAPTDAEGAWRLTVALAEAGRHGVVVLVPASAIDRDTGAAVGSAYTLRAPAAGSGGDHSVFVSPLTTLVQAHMDNTGATRAEAAELVQAQAGLAISPLDDFTAGSSEGQRQAALVARLVQLTALQQAGDLAGVVGSTDRSGALVTQAVVDAEIARSLIAALPSVAGAAIDPALAGASGSALQGTLQVLARALAAQVGLNAAQVQAGATASALAEPPLVPGVATASLTSLRYTDSDNWFMRVLESGPDDTVPDAQNRLRYHDVRLQSSSTALGAQGRTTGWARGSTAARAGDLHWDGSAWRDCRLTDRFLTGVRDAQGRHAYNYCNGLEEGSGLRRVVDISGRTQLAVVRDLIRTFPGGSQGVTYATWGPSNLSLYGSATFPTGANLQYQTNTTTKTAYSYDVQATNVVTQSNVAVSAGGDARVNPSLACADPLQNGVTTPVTTLEDLRARHPGKPCIFNQGGSTPNVSLVPNEYWGGSTVGLGDLSNTNTLPANTGNFYNTSANLRVAFAASGNRATFYRCYRQTSNNSSRNCSMLGIGTWSIQTLGDARVMSFSVLPALAQKLSYARVFIERGGKVYYGGKNPVGQVNTDVRLNLAAANAVMFQLGLPRIRPVTQPGTATGARAAALATLKGVWGGFNPNGTEATIFRFGDNGRFFMAEAKPYLPLTQEQAGAELGWFDYDPVAKNFSTLLEMDSNLTSGTSHSNPTDDPLTIAASALTIGTGANAFVIPRLETAAAGLVGLWALDSATDLSVPHIAFFSNGRAMFIVHDEDAQCLGGSATGQCPPGVEFSEYSFDAQSGAMRAFNLLYDTNGCQGLFDNCPAAVAGGSVNTERTLVFTFQAGNQTLSFVDGSGATRTLHRIAAQ